MAKGKRQLSKGKRRGLSDSKRIQAKPRAEPKHRQGPHIEGPSWYRENLSRCVLVKGGLRDWQGVLDDLYAKPLG